MMKRAFTSLLAVVLLCGPAMSAAPTGWACFAVSGDVYRASVGGDREVLADNVGAEHACWSYDGSLIFYIVGGGDIYALNNDGSDHWKIGNADDKKYSAIAAYRPEDRSVLCVDGSTFYKINADDKRKVEICAAGASVEGEIAISRDGTRIAYRSGDGGGGGRLKKLTVGASPTGYAGNCSASLSPNGNYLTENQSGHTRLKVINWDGGSSELNAGTIGHWDNQAFAVNSNDWICAMDDDPKTNDNVGYGVGIVSRSNNAYMVTSWSGSTVQYPRFFLGDLPAVSTPTTYQLSVTNGSGDGDFAAGTAVDIAADTPPGGKVFDRWTGDVSHVADVNASRTTVTMPEANVAVTATYENGPVQADPTQITSPREGDILTEGTEITLSARGSNLRWSYDASSDGLGEIGIGEGSSVTFTVPTNVSGPMTITIFCTGDNGFDQVECTIGQATWVAAHRNGHHDGTGISCSAYGAGATITFGLLSTQRVSLSVYDSRGERIRALIDRRFTGGFHSVVWDGRNASGTAVARGMYTMVLRTDAGTQSWMMIVRR